MKFKHFDVRDAAEVVGVTCDYFSSIEEDNRRDKGVPPPNFSPAKDLPIELTRENCCLIIEGSGPKVSEKSLHLFQSSLGNGSDFPEAHEEFANVNACGVDFGAFFLESLYQRNCWCFVRQEPRDDPCIQADRVRHRRHLDLARGRLCPSPLQCQLRLVRVDLPHSS